MLQSVIASHFHTILNLNEYNVMHVAVMCAGGLHRCDMICMRILDERCPTPVKRVLNSQVLARFFSRRLYTAKSTVYHMNSAAETVSEHNIACLIEASTGSMTSIYLLEATCCVVCCTAHLIFHLLFC